jgi:3'-phosphoadenosine 5'-phosphosulfate (PAPS) 3'-phosphatase
MDELLDAATAGCRVGAEVLRRYFRDAGLEVGQKGENDFVTRADRESEAAIVAEVRRRFPQHRILAEEGGGGGTGTRACRSGASRSPAGATASCWPPRSTTRPATTSSPPCAAAARAGTGGRCGSPPGPA